MEKLDDLKSILKQVIETLKLQELLHARKSGTRLTGLNGEKLPQEETEKAIEEHYSAIHKQIDGLR